jgi:hypothetical protein
MLLPQFPGDTQGAMFQIKRRLFSNFCICGRGQSVWHCRIHDGGGIANITKETELEANEIPSSVIGPSSGNVF